MGIAAFSVLIPISFFDLQILVLVETKFTASNVCLGPKLDGRIWEEAMKYTWTPQA